MQSSSCARVVFSRKTAITFYTLLIWGKKRHSLLAMPFLASMLSQFTASFRQSFMMSKGLYKFKFPLEQGPGFLPRQGQRDREFAGHEKIEAPLKAAVNFTAFFAGTARALHLSVDGAQQTK